MVIFALIAVVLLAIVGLAIDAGVSYFSSDAVQRAANAAALAGVAYLPGEFPEASNAAVVESARNGFPDKGTFTPLTGATSCTGSPSPCVLVSQPADNQLTVTVSVSVPTTFLELIGFGPHTVVRSATALYLPPISLGQPGAQQGSDVADLGTGGNYYFERDEGWGVPRSEGDAFDPSPNEGSATLCNGPCSATNHPDIHLISPAANSETEAESNNSINYTGGPSYLIDVPQGQSVDLQIFDPSFAPDSCGNSATTYCYHEDDTTFDSTSVEAFTAMEYSVYKVPTISQPGSGSLVSQEIFDPIDDTGSLGCSGFCYFNSPTTATALNCTPNVYHAWISALDYAPDSCDGHIFTDSVSLTEETGSDVLTGGATTDQYYRLEVDSLTWNGNPICTDAASCATAEVASTGDSAYPEAHKGYAVRLTTGPGTSTLSPTSTISALDDMTVFTPIINPSTTQPLAFGIPLFHLDPAYAGSTIEVDVFDPGDVSPGPAYMAVEQPDGTLATGAIKLLGVSQGSGGNTTVLPGPASPWPPTGQACTACFESASSSGVKYNGQWLQLQITVPDSLNTSSPSCVGSTDNCWSNYWTLQYDVAGGVNGDDTFSVQVGFNGSPERLLP
jgi:Flp pilus assembly protein TadG